MLKKHRSKITLPKSKLYLLKKLAILFSTKTKKRSKRKNTSNINRNINHNNWIKQKIKSFNPIRTLNKSLLIHSRMIFIDILQSKHSQLLNKRVNLKIKIHIISIRIRILMIMKKFHKKHKTQTPKSRKLKAIGFLHKSINKDSNLISNLNSIVNIIKKMVIQLILVMNGRLHLLQI